MLNMPGNFLGSIGCEAWQVKEAQWQYWQKTKETENKCTERKEHQDKRQATAGL